MRTTVIVITLCRPRFLRQCLMCLEAQKLQPDEVIVVDSSPDTESADVVLEFRKVLYARNESGYARMTTSRNIGLRMATGDVIAFLDDDSYAEENWMAKLVETYTCKSIGAVGGRALNGQAEEDKTGVAEIGRLNGNGTLSGFFAADPGCTIEVDHVMGCNMSFRREVLAKLGGFREDYPGISGVREDTDMSLRVKALGYRILFNPASCVRHIGAPQVTGHRFDSRYMYYTMQNHCVMLLRNANVHPFRFLRFLGAAGGETTIDCTRRIGGALVRVAAVAAGLLVGSIRGMLLAIFHSRSPLRDDADAAVLREWLSDGRDCKTSTNVQDADHECARYN